jgi:hypothetical protein
MHLNPVRRPTACRRAVLAVSILTVWVFTAVASAETPPPGDIPDNQAFVMFHGHGYSLEVPQGWSRTSKAGTTTFVDKYNAIAVTLATPATRPTVASTERGGLARLRRLVKGFAQPMVSPITRPAGSGVLITYRASSAPSDVTGKRITDDVERYELWRAGRLIVVTLEAPHGSDNVDAWKRVTTSVRWAP